MLEVLRDDCPFETIWVFHHKRGAVLGPTGDFIVALIDHVVGFCKIKNGRKASVR